MSCRLTIWWPPIRGVRMSNNKMVPYETWLGMEKERIEKAIPSSQFVIKREGNGGLEVVCLVRTDIPDVLLEKKPK